MVGLGRDLGDSAEEGEPDIQDLPSTAGTEDDSRGGAPPTIRQDRQQTIGIVIGIPQHFLFSQKMVSRSLSEYVNLHFKARSALTRRDLGVANSNPATVRERFQRVSRLLSMKVFLLRLQWRATMRLGPQIAQEEGLSISVITDSSMG